MRSREVNEDDAKEKALLDSIDVKAPFYSHTVSFYPLTAFQPDSLHQYTLSWIQSAHGAFRHISEDGGMKGNYLGYAVAGIHRHAVELALKAILQRGMRLGYGTGSITIDRLRKTHDISALARAVNRVLSDGGWETDWLDRWARVEQHLYAWQAGDNDGFALRYPMDTAGVTFAYDHGMDFSRSVLVSREIFRIWETVTPWMEAMEDNEREAQQYERE